MSHKAKPELRAATHSSAGHNWWSGSWHVGRSGAGFEDNSPVLLHRLVETMGANAEEYVPDLFTLFFQHTPGKLEAMRHHLRSGNHGEVSRTAHGLMSCAAWIGADSMASMCRRLEDLSREQIDEEVASLITAIGREYDRIVVWVDEGHLGWVPGARNRRSPGESIM